MARRLTLLLFLFAFVTLLLLDASRPPPRALGASVPEQEFSAERAVVHLREVAQRPHPPGSADHARVRRYLADELARLGLEVQVQEATAMSRGGSVGARVHNVLGRMRGQGGPGGAVLLAAHYDGVGSGPAASDDGAGVAVLLETARALLAGPPLRHDVVLLFSDAEEVGLLGAGAFVAGHPWAADVGAILNFEARGTRGRSVMFESAPGNGEVVAALAAYPDAETSSLWTPIYRALPNDTDLSRLTGLGVPALNFAFVDGLERYHSSEDDIAHLDPGSVQHHGEQALFLTRSFADSLPRATEMDAVFFRIPVLGMVRYPESWNRLLAAVLVLLVTAAGVRTGRAETRPLRGMLLGAAGAVAAATVGGLAVTLVLLAAPPSLATPGWRGAVAVAMTLAAVAAAAGVWLLLRRRNDARPVHFGALVVWSALALLTVAVAPGASFLFLWPAMAGAAYLLADSAGTSRWPRLLLEAVVVVVALTLMVPALYLVAVVGLGILEAGALLVGFFVPLLAFLLAPTAERLAGRRRWLVVAPAVAAVATLLVAVLVPRPAGAHPTKTALTYAVDVDEGTAWMASPAFMAQDGSWAAGALAAVARGDRGEQVAASAAPDWVRSATRYRPVAFPASPAPEPRVEVEPVADEPVPGGRRLSLRLRAPPETLRLEIAASGAPLFSVSVDGVLHPWFDPAVVGVAAGAAGSLSRTDWRFSYFAPPPEGVLLELLLAEGTDRMQFDLLALRSGLPAAVAARLPPRPPGVVVGLDGDATVVRQRFEM